MTALRRQLAAISSLERKRQCAGSGDRGSFFGVCADLANQREDVLGQMNRVAGPGHRSAGVGAVIKARLAALGCRAPGVQRAQERYASGPAMLFCVRLSDGYYFPAPNSQFVGESDYKTTLDRCRYICGEQAMDVYTLHDANLETEEMLSVEARKPYKELSVAFAYRTSLSFRACNLQRYHRRVEEAWTQAAGPSGMAGAAIPLPTPRPDMTFYSSIAPGKHPSPEQAVAQTPRHVRSVGPVFLPDDRRQESPTTGTSAP